MEFKGTMGDWDFDIDEFFEIGTLTSKNKSEVILEIQPTTNETPYNLLLCSKAPEMLKLLNKLTKATIVIDVMQLKEEARKLIKEATEL